jgi:hypothetical protein
LCSTQEKDNSLTFIMGDGTVRKYSPVIGRAVLMSSFDNNPIGKTEGARESYIGILAAAISSFNAHDNTTSTDATSNSIIVPPDDNKNKDKVSWLMKLMPNRMLWPTWEKRLVTLKKGVLSYKRNEKSPDRPVTIDTRNSIITDDGSEIGKLY